MSAYRDQIVDEIEESIATKRRVLQEQVAVIDEIAHVLINALRQGNKVLIFGNGGSAADAQHIAGELVSKFRRERRALPSISLTTDTSILTSIGNDFGYDYVFARQIEALGRAGDIAWGISTSGNSPNVLRAMKAAREQGMITIGFTGQGGGNMTSTADFCFRVPSQSTPRIQEAHITAAHILCELIEQEFYAADQ